MTLLPLLTLLLAAPPAEAGRKPVVPDVVEDALAYADTDRTKAITLLEGALADARAKEKGILALHAGEQHRLSGDADAARTHFATAATSGDKHAERAADLALVLLDAGDGVDARGLTILQKADSRVLPDTQNADRYLLLAVAAARRDDAKAVGANTKLALSYARADATTQQRVEAAIEALKAGGADAVAATSPTSDADPLTRVREALAKGDGPRAATLVEQVLPTLEPDSFAHLNATYLQKRANSGVAVDPDLVAVLLPLSGKYKGAAEQVQRALEMGYEKSGGTDRLVFIDTGATPESAVAALEDAVLRQGAIAVVGPLLSDTTDAIVRTAAAMEVPLLSLSQSNDATEHQWVFQGVPSVGDQTEALVKRMMVQEDMDRFAIFAPDTAYGRRASEAFRRSVEARQGTITREVYYDPEANALMEYAAKLGDKNLEDRKSELWKLQREAKAAGRDPSKVVLPPRVDFQAIFIPDSARKIPIACAALAYEEFPVGEFRPRPTDTLLPLLGLNGWNRDSLVNAGGEYARNSRFTDAFRPSANAAFSADYKATTGRTPTSLEAVTVDAGHLLASASKQDARDHEAFATALANASVTGSATGLTGLQDRRPDTPIEILTIDRVGIRGIDEVRPEPTDDE
jgi:ABC-type branched-subunit amino acid transport system substrate-binding protein